MRLYLRLAWRNIWRHKRRTIIIVVALAMCMWLMMFYDGLVGRVHRCDLWECGQDPGWEYPGS